MFKAATLDQIAPFISSPLISLSLCVLTVHVRPALFVLQRVNDVGEVQSSRPFPLQSTSVCICMRWCVHACDKLEQDEQRQYSENMNIFLPLNLRHEGKKGVWTRWTRELVRGELVRGSVSARTSFYSFRQNHTKSVGILANWDAKPKESTAHTDEFVCICAHEIKTAGIVRDKLKSYF